MKIRQTIQNPFALVAQGFAIGAALFWTTAPSTAEAERPATVASAPQSPATSA